MNSHRRHFLKTIAAGYAGSLLGGSCPAMASPSGERRFHLCAGPPAPGEDSSRLPLYRDSGVTDIWIPGFFYGHWPHAIDSIRAGKDRIESAGLACHIINIPLGHPAILWARVRAIFP